jgi:hypothetical protein
MWGDNRDVDVLLQGKRHLLSRLLKACKMCGLPIYVTFFPQINQQSMGNVYILLQGPMSSIVVHKSMQNMWTIDIRELDPTNKAGMICSKILFRVTVFYFRD